jgi:membrane-bound ClpP family serine protease
MRKLQPMTFTALILLLIFNTPSFADTFTHRQTNEVLHGYATTQCQNNQSTVHTQEKNELKLNLADWRISPDPLGRNNKVTVITIDGPIMLELTTAALEQTLPKAADEGPLFILLEIDTPGGRIDLAQRISAAISSITNCQIVGFVKGGEHGGAISAGVALALACDKLYMAKKASIGGAMPITVPEQDAEDLKKTYGEDVGEKFSSILKANLASMAEQHGRPGLLAKAMVDRNIEVVEVSDHGKRLFVEPVNKMSGQTLEHTWSKKGSLLTLTAEEAVKCTIADKIADSREELLRDMGAQNAEIIANDCFQQTEKEYKKLRLRLGKLRQSLDLKIKQLQLESNPSKALGLLQEIKTDFKSLLLLAKKYPDSNLNVQALENELNSAEAAYQDLIRQTRKHN